MANKFAVVNKYTNEIKVMNRPKKAAENIAKSLGEDWYVMEFSHD